MAFIYQFTTATILCFYCSFHVFFFFLNYFYYKLQGTFLSSLSLFLFLLLLSLLCFYFLLFCDSEFIYSFVSCNFTLAPPFTARIDYRSGIDLNVIKKKKINNFPLIISFICRSWQGKRFMMEFIHFFFFMHRIFILIWKRSWNIL